MIANRMKPVFVAGVLLAAAFSSPSHAGDDRGDSRWSYRSATLPGHAFNRDPAAFISKSGIFSGTFDTVRTASRSIYFLRSYRGTPLTSPTITSAESDALPPSVKIIDVAGTTGYSAFAPVNACSYEAGVCVIRGGN